ncbi:hypothetical protein ACJJIR_15405 [Microbulbifer sp. SSSA008]|uniref:hypothetical protein n=1 Tax=Microbulbifer sp. SSSA008 TaxID=3243380 RepID=UPI00403A5D99
MLDISLTSVKPHIKKDSEKSKKAYARLDQLKQHDEKLKALYAQKGLKKPEIMA